LVDWNRDIKGIRLSREEVGCSCRSIKVDKLSVAKMRQEMHHHCIKLGLPLTPSEINALSKADLSHKLRDVLKDHCDLCVANNCVCVQLGVPCHLSACGCMRSGASTSCRNPQGTSCYSPEEVNAHRKSFVTERRLRSNTM
jgi:hypothetical protein